MRDSVVYGVRDSVRALVGLPGATDELRDGEFWAVRDVSFEVGPGECLGIMGVNGSGKTTLLRVLNGIYAPDTGEVEIRGRIGALLAAGAGFSPLLTGRENIFVNGALLGMTHREIARRLDEIIDFAGVDGFIDTPVRHYSSGMQVRLGFAVAAISRPDVLLVDEVLAVGDMNFQKKCYEHIHGLKRDGTAILFVSHSMGAIWAICDTGLFLHQGVPEVCGPLEDVLRRYQERNSPEPQKSKPNEETTFSELRSDYAGNSGGTGDVVVLGTQTLAYESLEPKGVFAFGEPFVIESEMEVRNTIHEPNLRYAVDAAHLRFINCMDSHEQGFDARSLQPGRYRIRTFVPAQNFMPGSYGINCGICDRKIGVHLFFQHGACSFKVLPPNERVLFSSDTSIMYLDTRFEVSPCERRQAA